MKSPIKWFRQLGENHHSLKAKEWDIIADERKGIPEDSLGYRWYQWAKAWSQWHHTWAELFGGKR